MCELMVRTVGMIILHERNQISISAAIQHCKWCQIICEWVLELIEHNIKLKISFRSKNDQEITLIHPNCIGNPKIDWSVIPLLPLCVPWAHLYEKAFLYSVFSPLFNGVTFVLDRFCVDQKIQKYRFIGCTANNTDCSIKSYSRWRVK